MSDLKRPAAVPLDAVWVVDEQEWQIGSILCGTDAPRGECKAWRADGSLAATYTLDSKGWVQGVVTRFHPDGTVASRGEWKDGDRFGQFMFQQSEQPTPEVYQAETSTWRYEFTAINNHLEENERWFLKDGTPSTSDGRALATAFDMDAVIEQSSPEDFLSRHSANCYKAFYGKEPASFAHAAELGDFWGLEEHKLSNFTSTLIGYRASALRKFSGNCWESLIADPWDNLYEELSGIFMGAACVGSIGDSDQLYLTLFHPVRPVPRANAAYFWTHELYYLDSVVALSEDDFSFACAISKAHKAERLTDDVAARAWRKLANKVDLPWGLRSGVDHVFGIDTSVIDSPANQRKRQAFFTAIDVDGYVRNYYWRAQWLTRLMVADADRNFSDVKESFDESRNRPLNAVEFEDILRTGQTVAPTALYLLWRLFWTRDARLKEGLKRYETHQARVVRDLVDLIQRFEAGLKGIKGISDVEATRESFLKLGLF